MYKDFYSEQITEKLAKLKKKDSKHYSIVMKKIEWILVNPEHRFKDLHYTMKGFSRVHIGHFVLVFSIDKNSKQIIFEDYDHHDIIYNS